MVDTVGADGLVLCMGEDETGEHLVVHPKCTIEDAVIERWAHAPDTEPLPARDALRSRSPVVTRSRADGDRRYPELRDIPMDREGWVIVSLLASRDRRVGVLLVAFADEIEPAEVDLAFVQAVGDLFAAALHRAMLYESQRTALERAQFLAEAGAFLAQPLDLDVTLQRPVRLAVPRLSDICVVCRNGAGEVLTPVAVAHADLRGQRVLDELVAYGQRLAHPELQRVLETGESTPLTTVDVSSSLAERRGPASDSTVLLRGMGTTSALAVRMAVCDRPVGIVVLSGTGGEPVTNDATVAVAEALADRAAVAIDNARLYAERDELSRQLQEALQSRTVIEQAKGALGATRGIDHEEAFALLRQQARNQGRRLHEVARELVATLTR